MLLLRARMFTATWISKFMYMYRSIAFVVIFKTSATDSLEFLKASYFLLFCNTVEPRYNEGSRDWQNLFAITRFRYGDVLFSYSFTITGVKKKKKKCGHLDLC